MNGDEQVKKHFETGKALREHGLNRAACVEFQKAAEITPASPDLLLEWGQALFGKGDFQGAVDKYQKVTELDSTRGDAYTLWGEALTAQEKHEESAEKYAKAVAVDPLNIDAYLGWANALCAQAKWKEAIEVYKKVIEGDLTRDIFSGLATALEKLGTDEKAKTVKELETRLSSDARYAVALTNWGEALAAQEKYDEAVEQYRKASRVDPAFAQAYVGWGSALRKQGKYTEALDCYLKAIERDPGHFRSFRGIDDAIANLKKEESAAATKRLTEILRSDPKNASFYCRWGRGLAKRKLYAEAISRYQDALQLDPRLVDAFLGGGDSLAAQQKRDEAIEQYRHATLIDPGSARAYRKWAGVLSSQGHYAKAAERYQRAIENDKGLESVDFSELLELLANLDSEEKAHTLQVLETALASAGLAERYIEWGDALSEKERYAEALAQYEKALQIDDKAPDTWRKMADAQKSLRDYSKAIESYRKMTELDPYDGSAYFEWGKALLEQKKFSEATEKYCQAAELMDNPSETHLQWGWALGGQRKYGEAIEWYKKALEADRNYVAAYNAWGWALYSQEKYDEAVEQYEEAVKKHVDDAPTHWYWGLALVAQRMNDEAIAHYEKALELNREDPYPYLDWANALDEQGRREDAIQVCNEATRVDGDFAYAYHNIAHYLWVQAQYEASRKAWETACKAYERTKQKKRKERDADFFQYYGGVLYESIGNLEKSEQVLQEGLGINPDHTGILSALVTLYLERNDEPLVKENKGGDRPLPYRSFRRRDPGPREDKSGERPPAYWKAREHFLKAERILKQRLAMYEDSRTLQELGDLYLKMGVYDEAESYLEKALKKDPRSPAPYASLGVLCSRKEDFRQAIQYFEGARRQNPDDLDGWSNLAETYLKLNPKELKQIEKAEAEFKMILEIAPQHIDSLIGLGEVYTAMAEVGETDFYEMAMKRYSDAIQLADAGKGSKRLKTRELAAVHYSRGYARVKLYEASKPFGDESLLSDALEDFRLCASRDPHHCKAERARDKLDKRRSQFSRRWFAEKVAPWLVLVPSLFVLAITQLTFFFGVPQLQKPIEVASYIALTFGSLIFVVVGLFLPEIQKLKGAGIELEKSAVTQISTSGSFGISK